MMLGITELQASIMPHDAGIKEHSADKLLLHLKRFYQYDKANIIKKAIYRFGIIYDVAK